MLNTGFVSRRTVSNESIPAGCCQAARQAPVTREEQSAGGTSTFSKGRSDFSFLKDHALQHF